MLINNPFYVFVNSRDRKSGNDSDFTFDVSFPSGMEFTHVVCLNALIPKSYYLIQDDAKEHTFELMEDDTTVKIVVPVGSYLLTAFKTVVGDLLTSNSPNGLVYNLSYPSIAGPDTGKWTYTQTNSAIQSTLTFNDHLFEPFGFYKNSTNMFNGTTLVSTCVIKLQSEDRLLLHSDIVDNLGKDDVLVSINSTSSINYSSINYLCPAPEFYTRTLNSNTQNTCRFSLTDEQNEPLNLNGLNLNFTLLFYKKDDIFEKIKAFLKMAVLPEN